MPRYDLFRLDECGPLWFGTAETMRDVHLKAAELTDCPECIVLDSVTGEKIVLKAASVRMPAAHR
jgi:hypothetical protein